MTQGHKACNTAFTFHACLLQAESTTHHDLLDLGGHIDVARAKAVLRGDQKGVLILPAGQQKALVRSGCLQLTLSLRPDGGPASCTSSVVLNAEKQLYILKVHHFAHNSWAALLTA